MFHKGALKCTIRNEAKAASSRSTRATAHFPVRPLVDEPKQPDPRAARPHRIIMPSAAAVAIRLNELCSTSFRNVKRKFCEGSRPDESACEILTQRCS